MSYRFSTHTWLTGILVLLFLTLTACGDSAPPLQVSLIDRALMDTSLRERLIERGAVDEEFVHERRQVDEESFAYFIEYFN